MPQPGAGRVPAPKVEPEVSSRAKLFLCASYALAAWAWRSWEFIVALVLIYLYPNSLLMVSAYGLLDNLARVLLGPAVGSYIDRHERLPGAKAMLRLQNLCIGGSAAAALALLWPHSAAYSGKAAYWSLMWLLTVLGAASSAGSTGVSISVEREAVKALCVADSRALAALNSVMRAIDLTALLCAPLAAGLLMTAAGPFAAAAAMACYCGAAYVPEVLLLQAAFRAAPVLGRSKVRAAAGAVGGADAGRGGGDCLVSGSDPAAHADADERTGLLARCNECAEDDSTAKYSIEAAAGGNGGGGSGAAVRVSAATAPQTATDAGPRPSCFAQDTRRGGSFTNVRRGALAARRAAGDGADDGNDDNDDDDDADSVGQLAVRADSSRLSQPLLLGAADSLPISVSAAWAGDGDGDAALSACSRSHHGEKSSLSRSVVEAETAVGGGGKLSATSSMIALAVSAAHSGSRNNSSSGGGVAAAALHAAACQLAAYGDSWRVYLRQRILLPCLALALLYMTVLSLGFLMTSFLKWSHLTEAEVSGYRGIGALTGLAATAIFPPLSARAGVIFCAVAGVTYQLTCLAAGVLPVVASAMSGGGALTPSVIQVRILVAGLVSSRTGLWLYDLAVTQLIQEDVRQDQLGSVYGVQSSLQASFEMLSFVAGLLNHRPERFHLLMLGSLGSVAAAAVLVWCYACLQRRRAAPGGASGGDAAAV